MDRSVQKSSERAWLPWVHLLVVSVYFLVFEIEFFHHVNEVCSNSKTCLEHGKEKATKSTHTRVCPNVSQILTPANPSNLVHFAFIVYCSISYPVLYTVPHLCKCTSWGPTINYVTRKGEGGGGPQSA